MKRIFVLLLACLTLSCTATDTGPAADLGRTEQEKMRAMFYGRYTPYLKEYVEVYVAQVICKFDFIDEATFNDLADRVIQHAVKDVDKALQGSAFGPIRDGADARAYLANFIAFGMIDAQSTLLSERPSPDYSRPGECDNHRGSIRDSYTALPDMASKILAGM